MRRAIYMLFALLLTAMMACTEAVPSGPSQPDTNTESDVVQTDAGTDTGADSDSGQDAFEDSRDSDAGEDTSDSGDDTEDTGDVQTDTEEDVQTDGGDTQDTSDSGDTEDSQDTQDTTEDTDTCTPVPEVCDGEDNDCDGLVDEKDSNPNSPMTRTSGLTEGICSVTFEVCCREEERNSNQVVMEACEGKPNGTWSAYEQGTPPETETCDGLDNDCDGDVDEGLSCNCTNGDTRDCGTDLGMCSKGTQECVNGSWGACQGATMGTTEVCDGLDNDCDGQTDEDYGRLGSACTQGIGACEAAGSYVCSSDGSSTVCDATPTTGSNETCDGVDNDCDGTVDENLTRQCGQTDVGECSYGIETCNNGSWGSCQGNVDPMAEVCDSADNDCDGDTDEGQVCVMPTVCGDGVVESGEECDDDNDVSGDGCSSICQIESGYACDPSLSECTSVCPSHDPGTSQVSIYVESDGSVTVPQVLRTHCVIEGQVNVRQRTQTVQSLPNAISTTPLMVKKVDSLVVVAEYTKTLQGLENLEEVTDRVLIRWNDTNSGTSNRLSDISALSGLKSIGTLEIRSDVPGTLYIPDDLRANGQVPFSNVTDIGRLELHDIGPGSHAISAMFTAFGSLTNLGDLEITYSASISSTYHIPDSHVCGSAGLKALATGATLLDSDYTCSP